MKKIVVLFLPVCMFGFSCSVPRLTGQTYVHVNPDNVWHLELYFSSDSTFSLKNAKPLPNYYFSKGKYKLLKNKTAILSFQKEYEINPQSAQHVKEFPKDSESRFRPLPFSNTDTVRLLKSSQVKMKKLIFYTKK